jgi:hypothetical protein
MVKDHMDIEIVKITIKKIHRIKYNTMHLLKSNKITVRSVTDVTRMLQVVDCVTYSGDSIYT